MSGDGLRQGSWRRRACAGFATLALAGLTVPATAPAGEETGTDLGTEGGLNYRVNVAEDFNGTGLDSFVACLDGDRPISGGIDLSGAATAGRMGGTYPAADFGGPLVWRSAGHNLSAMPIDMSFFAVCRKSQPQLSKLRSASKPVEPGDRRTVKAPCPDGFRVTGGGLQSTNPIPSASVPYDGKDQDKKPDDGWKATAVNSFAQPADVTAWASCRKAGNWDLKYVTEEGTVPGVSALAAEVVCEQGVVTGGGASITGASGLVRLHETFPSDFGDPDDVPADSWLTNLRNGQAGEAPGVFYAICKT